MGPFRFSTHDFLVGDPLGSLYSGKLVEGPDGRLCYLAWRNFAPDGAFVGELADPLPIAVDGGGYLSVRAVVRRRVGPLDDRASARGVWPPRRPHQCPTFLPAAQASRRSRVMVRLERPAPGAVQDTTDAVIERLRR